MNSFTNILTILYGYVTLFYQVRGFQNDPKCGRDYINRNPKIIGGQTTNETEFPWYVSIKETGQHGCGGFIINEKTVLTAAHCFKDFSDRATNSPKTISVTLAMHNLNQDKDTNKYTKWEQDVNVKRIIRHPHYDAFNDSGLHDIALLLLEKKNNWNDATIPVCLPINTASSSVKPHTSSNKAKLDLEVNSGEVAVVAGWSSNHIPVDENESSLKKVQLTIYNNEECKRILHEKNVTLKAEIDSSVICAGSNETGFDSCTGDSGSALLVKRGKVWVAVGIVSSGFGECGSSRPGLYTRISSYISWIDLHNDQIDSSVLFQKLSSFVPTQAVI